MRFKEGQKVKLTRNFIPWIKGEILILEERMGNSTLWTVNGGYIVSEDAIIILKTKEPEEWL